MIGLLRRVERIQCVHSGTLESKFKQFAAITVIFMLLFSDISTSAWSTEGVETQLTLLDPDTGKYHVTCRSTHLTSFAVLLDVTTPSSTEPPITVNSSS